MQTTRPLYRYRYAIVALTLCLTPAVALAYINPGNGAYMVQALFTLLGAGMFYLRHPSRLIQAMRLWFAARRDALRRSSRATVEESSYSAVANQAEGRDSR